MIKATNEVEYKSPEINTLYCDITFLHKPIAVKLGCCYFWGALTEKIMHVEENLIM